MPAPSLHREEEATGDGLDRQLGARHQRQHHHRARRAAIGVAPLVHERERQRRERGARQAVVDDAGRQLRDRRRRDDQRGAEEERDAAAEFGFVGRAEGEEANVVALVLADAGSGPAPR
jgi:hypothetical protein